MTTLVAQATQPLGYPGGDNPTPGLYFDARETVISQYANSPVILALIDALNGALDWQARIEGFYATIWNIETAVGAGLDIWGRIVGVSRALYLSTGEYLGFSEASDAKTFGEGIFWGGAGVTSNYNLTDEAYRQVILAKAAQNITDCSVRSVNAILRSLFSAYGNVYVRDNLDMTMTFVFGAEPSKVDYAIVGQSGVLPKPLGVSMTIETP